MSKQIKQPAPIKYCLGNDISKDDMSVCFSQIDAKQHVFVVEKRTPYTLYSKKSEASNLRLCDLCELCSRKTNTLHFVLSCTLCGRNKKNVLLR
jgi:hypothetical protein